MEPFSIEEYKQTYLSEPRLKWLYEEKLFKLFVPKVYGGLELPMKDGAIRLIEAAQLQGGLGWTINLGAGANWFSGFFKDEAAKEIFSPKNAVIAGSGFTSGTWEKEDDLFRINGAWTRCTGAKHATFFSLNARNNKEGVKTFVVPRSQIKLSEEKWPIFGLRNTSSYAIDIDQQDIPSRFSFQINGELGSHSYGVHRIPFEVFARLCMSASFIGIVQCFIDQCKVHPLNQKSLDLIETSITPEIKEAERNCLDWADKIDKSVSNDDQMTDQLASEMKTSLGSSNVKLYQFIQELFLNAGLPLVEEDNIVHWAYRDVLTAVQHYMVKP